ncbi:MAG: histidinol-phosphatase HisJ family protein [Clostridiaceae bacterium]|nr:histidinol-phosphatase HisJ family protein [Clostridiaceae bacterium]
MKEVSRIVKYADLHMHSKFSFDGKGDLFAMCEAAEKLGASALAFTEHWDALPENHVELPYEDGREYYHQYDAAARRTVMDARERYNGRVNIIYAIELGQPHTNPVDSRKFLDAHDFDFVLGSIHNIASGLDYYYVDYASVDIPGLFRDYYAAHLEMLKFGHIDAIAHLDYPVRKMERVLQKPGSMLAYRDYIAEVVRAAAKEGVGIEINTNGLRNWFGRLSPEPWVLELYRDFGGTFVTTGSDAHNTDYAAFGIMEASALAQSLGLKVVCGFTRHSPVFL